MKVTFDTNVLLSSTLWDGSVAQKLLIKLLKEDVVIYSSIEILKEYHKILKRDFDFSEENTVSIMEKVLSFVNLVVPKKKVRIIKEDPTDNKIIECALESKSKYIITYNKHLLKIKKYEGIEIIKPEDLIGLL